jgi:cobalt-zinc-cadmium efflux system protein
VGRALPLHASIPTLEPCPPEGCQGLTPPPRSLKPLAISLGVVVVMIAAQIVGYFLTHSLAVAFEALHVCVDAGAICLGMFAIWIARRPATAAKTFGWHRVEILTALLNGTALVAITVNLAKEAWDRLTNPGEAPHLEPRYMIVFGAIGLAGNLVNVWLISRGHAAHSHGPDDHEHSHSQNGEHEHHADLNLQGVLLHQISDALASLGAIVAGALILWKGWTSADAIVAAIMSILILAREVMLCLRAVDVLLESTPRHVDVAAFEAALKRVAPVREIHDLHIWTLTSGVYAMSCHALVDAGADHRRVLAELKHVIKDHHGIDHVTIQIEERDAPVAPAAA